MDDSPEKVRATVGNGSGVQLPEHRTARRRLIQSTLFPHRPQDNEKDREYKKDECSDRDEDDEYEEEECLGSQRQKSRKRKSKAVAQTRVSKKVSSGGREAPNGRTEITNKRSPHQVKRKGKINTTPTKEIFVDQNSGTADVMDRESDQGKPQQIPDLRLEAKLTAEENSRIFAGKKIHPFFSSRKMGKRSQETVETVELVEDQWCRNDESIGLGPIHVFETVQDDFMSPEWRNWVFYARALTTTCLGPEIVRSSVFEGSVECLRFDNFQPILKPHRTPFDLNEVPLKDYNIQQDSHTLTPSRAFADQTYNQPSEVIELDHNHETDEARNYFSGDDYVRNSESEQQGRFLQEGMSYYGGCDKQPKNSLWTNKYQPEKAAEVCGNGESVKFISEWLHLWLARDSQTGKDFKSVEKLLGEDSNYDFCQSSSDTGNVIENAGLKNVLLVSGPIGSGKSAAIYACAKEQGFQVIEVSASDWRNGALVKQRFGEAVESHWVKWSVEDPVGSQNKHNMQSFPFQNSFNKEDNEVLELVSLLDEEDSEYQLELSDKYTRKGSRSGCNQGEIMSLILFEDVDTIFDEDRGFIATIQLLAETAKRPIILTSNRDNPPLPDNLDRLVVCFTMPPSKELLNHVHMVCNTEKANIQPHLMERFIGYCHGDIRKTIMLLQFWCQGITCRKDNKMRSRYGPLLFDIDAAYRILPVIFPWDFSSQLSEIVEKEITLSLSMMEENPSLEGFVEAEQQKSIETDSIEAKKEEMLSRYCSVFEENGIPSHLGENSDSSGFSPVAFSRRNSRRNFDQVMVSNSDDEKYEGFPSMLGNLGEDNSKLLFYEETTLNLNSFPFSELENNIPINGTYNSGEMSCVPESCLPESTIVPETEINDGVTFSSYVEANNYVKTKRRLHKLSELNEGNYNLNAKSVRKEEVGDSQYENLTGVSRGYQVMDECSRVDFNRGPYSVEKPRSHFVVDSVQETWRKLRGGNTDLRQYVTPEQKDASQVVELACRMSNLISEADLMLYDCQPLIVDSLEPSMVPCEERRAFSWYDEQLEMASTTYEHGFCFYAKKLNVLETSLGTNRRVDLAKEMLTSVSNNAMALGKLVEQDMSTNRVSFVGGNSEIRTPNGCMSIKREAVSSLYNLIYSVVPAKSRLALKCEAFHEYLSSLCRISRSESSRLSESIDNTRRRRGRLASHYLSSGALTLSPEEICLVGQYNCYGKASSQSMDGCFR